MLAPLQEWLATAYRGDEPPATESRLRNIESQIGLRLPHPVRFVMTTLYRPEGFVGGSYIAFFTLDDFAQSWRDAQGGRTRVHSDSPATEPVSGTASTRGWISPAFVLMPSIGTEWGAAMLLGATWDEFWETLERGNLFDRSTSQPRSDRVIGNFPESGVTGQVPTMRGPSADTPTGVPPILATGTSVRSAQPLMDFIVSRALGIILRSRWAPAISRCWATDHDLMPLRPIQDFVAVWLREER